MTKHPSPNVETVKFTSDKFDAIKYTGANDDEVTEFLGRSDWRNINGVPTQNNQYLTVQDGELYSFPERTINVWTKSA